MIEGPVPELLELLVERRADAAHLGLGDARGRSERLYQVIDLSGGHPVHVGLHDHGVQSPVDAPAALEERGEERPLPQLGDPQLHVAGRGGQEPGPVPVALGVAVLGALVASSPDRGCGLSLDELLEDPLKRAPDAFCELARLDRVEQFGQVRLGEGHRGLLSCSARNTPRFTPVAHRSGGPPPIYTTPRDVPGACAHSSH